MSLAKNYRFDYFAACIMCIISRFRSKRKSDIDRWRCFDALVCE